MRFTGPGSGSAFDPLLLVPTRGFLSLATTCRSNGRDSWKVASKPAKQRLRRSRVVPNGCMNPHETQIMVFSLDK